MKILIAEDDGTTRLMLSSVLRKSGHEVVEAVNGRDALAVLLAEDAPQLAILDWVMPEMDGVEVVRKVREVDSERPPYLIMLTAKNDKQDTITGLSAGANDYLPKPFDRGELKARLDVGCRMVELQTALIESRERLAYQASHDVLTGIFNRRAILERLKEEMNRAVRCGGGLAVGLCDIDRFKSVNDTFGHQTGDDVLRAVTGIFQDSIRQYDAIGRFGGEEFLLIVPIAAGTHCVPLFERLCARVAQSKIQTKSGEMTVTISIGVTVLQPGDTIDGLLGAADKALYAAKDAGRNQVAFTEERELSEAGGCRS